MTTSDEGLRGFQPNGKQLVFLFMAVTVVSVVIFLCGVLVGRGVQGRTAVVEAPVEETADAPGAVDPPATPSEGPTRAEDLGYPERLQASGPTTERLVTRPDPPRAAPAATPAAAPTATAADTPAMAAGKPTLRRGSEAPAGDAPGKDIPARSAPGAPGPEAGDITPIPAEPKGDGVAIQVAALRGRGEAEAVVSRLKGKGYAAYLMAPLAGQPSMYRVRVGKFKTRTEAEKVATQLEREEQFKPWITR